MLSNLEISLSTTNWFKKEAGAEYLILSGVQDTQDQSKKEGKDQRVCEACAPPDLVWLFFRDASWSLSCEVSEQTAAV